jgi:hypothetical protein
MDNLMRRLGALLRHILVRNGGTQQPGEAAGEALAAEAASPFGNCDDTHDAAAQAVEAINDRLSRLELGLTAESQASLCDVIARALELATVEEVAYRRALETDPTALAFALGQQLDHLAELELEGEEVSARDVLMLEARLEAALAAEAALHPTRDGERF